MENKNKRTARLLKEEKEDICGVIMNAKSRIEIIGTLYMILNNFRDNSVNLRYGKIRSPLKF